MALMISACSSNDIEQTAQQPNHKAEGIPFTATISIGESATTRALTESGSNIVPSWAAGEKVALIHNDVIDVVEVQSVSNGLATLTGTLTGSPANDDDVMIIYPSSAADGTTGNVKADLLAAQDGTLATIAEKYDVRKGAGTLNVGTTATLYGNVSLTNQFAIVKFSLTDGYTAIKATQFVIKDGSDNVITTVTLASATKDLYVAMAPATASAFRFVASDGTNTYNYDNPSATLAAGTYYQSSMAMADEALSTPLTFEAEVAGVTIKLNTIDDSSGPAAPNVLYSIDGGTSWIDLTNAGVTLASAGDKVLFRGSNASYYVDGTSDRYQFTITGGTCFVYGNIMSLIDKDNYPANKILTADYAFRYLFRQQTNIKYKDADHKLYLPATRLTKYCYQRMFDQCSALTVAPELPGGDTSRDPGAKLDEYCYSMMFSFCTNLSTAPNLPATTLAEGCYTSMFNGCMYLTNVPAELPATELKDFCYSIMFAGCSYLTKAPKLPATTLKKSCYDSMFESCTQLEDAWVKAAYTTTNNECRSMFSDYPGSHILHTTTANQASWDAEMGSTKTWSSWIAFGDWND